MGKEVQTILNLLSEGIVVEGDIRTTKDIRIDGTLVGTVQTNGRLVLGPASKVTGGVNSPSIDIYGQVEGDRLYRVEKRLENQGNDNHAHDDC